MKTQTSIITITIAGVDVFVTQRVRLRAAGIELHHAGCVGDCFHPGERENDADKCRPVLTKRAVERLEGVPRAAEMRDAERTKRDHD